MSENINKRIKIIPINSERKTIKLENTVEQNISVKTKKSKKNFQCILCERNFLSLISFKKHLMRIHKIDKIENNLQNYYIWVNDEENHHAVDSRVDSMRFNVPRNLKTYTRKPKPIIKQEIKDEPEFILPD